jgi:transcriptional regulator of heat shock response
MEKNRRQKILFTIISEYIKTAQAVSSGLLAKKYKLGISPATIRHEMTALEESGYIYQPHTSAGRIPSEKAYLEFIKSFSGAWPKIKAENLQLALKEKHDLRLAAKSLALSSNNAIFWAFHKNDLYYTGLSNLFSQPEFKQSEVVCDVSLVIDRMEEIIDQLFNELKEGIVFKIGLENPFAPFLGTVFLKYKINKQSALCGILGPMRMDYLKSAALLEIVNNNFKK